MTTLEIWLLALALAMDCFAVSTASGIIIRKISWRIMLPMSLLFGFFQAAMPLLGWLGLIYFSEMVEDIGHWIAFAMLALIGGKMVIESFEKEEKHSFDPSRLLVMVSLAVATSIDALAVGVSFACIGYDSIYSLFIPISCIGLVSFLMTIIGFSLGATLGNSFGEKLRPELIGGITLILIGLKIILSH